jgi:hypothetical protein
MFSVEMPLLFDGINLMSRCDKRRGIYCWLNTTNGKKYVGMAAGADGFRGRVGNEVYAARQGRHYSTPLLCAAVKKYGLESFRVVELLCIDAGPVIFGQIERAFIATYKTLSPNGYNLTEGGAGTLGHYSITGSEKRRGVKRPEIAEKRAKRCELLSPDGTRHYVHNISAFSIAQGFSPTALHGVASGAVKSYKGWRRAGWIPDEYARSMAAEAYFVSPVGEVVRVKNIKRFALANGLSQGSLNGVWTRRKHYNSCKGWRRASEEQIASFDPLRGRTWEHDKWV